MMRAILIILVLSTCIFASSCSNSKKYERRDYVAEMNDAFDKKDFNKAKLVCDELYEHTMKEGVAGKKLWLSFCYYMICVYSTEGGQAEVLELVELYTSKFTMTGDFAPYELSSVAKNKNPKWFFMMERSEKLIHAAYEQDPSSTIGEIEDYDIIGFKQFCEMVIHSH